MRELSKIKKISSRHAKLLGLAQFSDRWTVAEEKLKNCQVKREKLLELLKISKGKVKNVEFTNSNVASRPRLDDQRQVSGISR